jgi:hypothetical protein
MISNRQVRHDIIELPFKRRIRREGCPDQLSQRPEHLGRIGREPEHLIAEPGTAHEVVLERGYGSKQSGQPDHDVVPDLRRWTKRK